MRMMTLVLSFLLVLLLTGMAMTYVPAYVGERRVYVQSAVDSTPETSAYQSYGHASVSSDIRDQRNSASDPNRYYSESEGWTYYTLPSNNSGQ